MILLVVIVEEFAIFWKHGGKDISIFSRKQFLFKDLGGIIHEGLARKAKIVFSIARGRLRGAIARPKVSNIGRTFVKL
jgi:hypothetical protein